MKSTTLLLLILVAACRIPTEPRAMAPICGPRPCAVLTDSHWSVLVPGGSCDGLPYPKLATAQDAIALCETVVGTVH